jgi:hypothetical protein
MAVADFLNPLISATSGLVGVFLGGWLTNLREQKKARSDFIKCQLSEFYGPLVAMRTEIRTRSELRLKIEQSMDQGYAANLLEAIQYSEALDGVTDTQISSILTVRRDEFKIFNEMSMPLYRRMLETFREKMWLAEPETRQYLPALIEYVDVWERHLRDALPDKVVTAINHGEQNLHPFYEHLAVTHDRLRKLIG